MMHLHRPMRLLDMLRFYAARFLRALDDMAAVRGIAGTNTKTSMDSDVLNSFNERLDDLETITKEMNLKLTRKSVEKLKEHIKQSDEPVIVDERMLGLFGEITTRFEEELEDVILFAITDHADKFNQFAPLFGEKVDGQFASVRYDISEAGMCLAVRRPTATVFHLMRVVEVALGAIARSLGVPDPIKDAERNWGAALRKIKAEIDRRNVSEDWSDPSDKEYFANIYTLLEAVRAAWRNTTMHIEKKYTGDEAEDIYYSVRGFMRGLASRLDENGHPLA